MTAMKSWALAVGLGLCCQWVAAQVQPQSQYEITYLSGGVGDDERQAMQALRQDYNLLLTFATKGSGEYLVDVAVTIRDQSGMAVASFVSQGPLCQVRLAPGSYRVQATVHGKELSQKVLVKAHRGRALYFYWDAE
ncbi:carboxypeptidase regulatory-like domain-containing protein [Oxalobacteraceae bacterium]|nr:carboxypeptidase regulatory-like domain-containing protein [Oxalobacteraceae bacterium]